MKKFSALLAALSLLVFAGSAFATTINASQTAVTVTAGETATATITAAASHGGDLSYALTGDGAAFASLSSTTGTSTTVTFAPAATVQANMYTVTVTVTETYGGDPSGAGHARPQTETATANIAVTVDSPIPPLSFTVTPSATTIMAGETVNFTFSSTGGNGAATYSLVDALDGIVFGRTAAVFTPKAAGQYTLVFTATDALGIGAVQVQTVTINVAEVLSAKAVLSKNPVSVDEQVTVTLTATGGIGASTFTTTTSGVTLGATSNNTATATFRSSESGIFSLRFTATDTASHTANANVSVIVDAPAPEPEAEDVVETVEEEEKEETVTTTAHELDSELTTEVNDDAINNTMSKNAGDAIANDDSYSEEEKALAKDVDAKNEAAVDDLKATGTFPANAESVPQDEVTVTPSSNTDLAGTVAEDNANSGRGGSAPIMGFDVSSPRDGIVKIPTPRQPLTLWGFIIRVLKGVANVNNRAMPGFTAAADDTDTTVFLDSNGNVTTTIPTSVDVNGNPRIGGFMTMATYVKANEPVNMILSIPTEELDNAGVSTTQTTKEVVLPSFKASGTSFFSTFVSSDLLTESFANYYRVGENVLTAKVNNVVVREDWKRTDEELAMATDNNYTMITRLATLDASAEAGSYTYIVAANFVIDDAKRERIDTTDEGGFIFYPNGPANAAANCEVLKYGTRADGTTGLVEATPEDIKNGLQSGYIAFSLAGGDTLTKPMLAVNLTPATTPVFSFALSTSGIRVQQGSRENVTITPVNNSGDVTYMAYEGTTELSWVSFNDNTAVFAPTTSTAARTYNVTIIGSDADLNVYSADISVTVTSSGGGQTEALTLTSSKSSLTVALGDMETLQLSSNALGTATYAVSAPEEAGVALDTATGEALIVPEEAGSYSLVFTVTDSGRASGSNTATITVPMTVTASRNPGGSSGGCDAGFGALALAVLGGLIAARKK